MKTKLLIVVLFFLICLIVFSCGRRRMDELKLNPLFKNFAPQKQSFKINPLKKNVITGKKGTHLTIPKEVFDINYDDLNKEDTVTVKLIEVMDTFDFPCSGIELTYYDENGEEKLFESAGMFKVTADYKGKELALADNKKIKVEFPNLVPGDKFNVYKINKKGEWQYDGHNQELAIEEWATEDMVIKDSDGVERILKPTVVKTISVRRYYIDALTWWNFDYPVPLSVCISGKIDGDYEKYFQVAAIGISRKGYQVSTYYKGNEFKVDAFIKTDIKIVIISDKGIGYSKTFNTGDKPGTKRYKEGPNNFYMKIKKIELKNINDYNTKDRKKFLQSIGIKEKIEKRNIYRYE